MCETTQDTHGLPPMIKLILVAFAVSHLESYSPGKKGQSAPGPAELPQNCPSTRDRPRTFHRSPGDNCPLPPFEGAVRDAVLPFRMPPRRSPLQHTSSSHGLGARRCTVRGSPLPRLGRTFARKFVLAKRLLGWLPSPLGYVRLRAVHPSHTNAPTSPEVTKTPSSSMILAVSSRTDSTTMDHGQETSAW